MVVVRMPPANAVRRHLVDALIGDLVGPYADEEVLKLPPSRWYLTGFLVPREAREAAAAQPTTEAEAEADDPTADEEIAAGNDEPDEEGSAPEPEAKQKN